VDIDLIVMIVSAILVGVAVGVVFGPKDTVTVYVDADDHDSYRGDD
jgi:hypothetical protein